MPRRRWGALVVLCLSAAACAGGAAPETTEAESTTIGPTQSSTTDAPQPTLPDYFALVDGAPEAANDRSFPEVEPQGPVGAYGFSRYVFSTVGDEVVPTLIEGPRGFQYRCQSLELECSFEELRALVTSGGEVPDYLGMDREELETLVQELDLVREAVDRYPTLEQACAAGFQVQSSQNPNMGIHATNPDGTSATFDPARPSMVLYAKDGGERLTQGEQGNCVDGSWTGEPGYRSVGAVFTLVLTDEHPEGFSGPIDNWHIHFNTCAGSPLEGATLGQESIAQITQTGSAFDRTTCEEAGGSFREVIPIWMTHAYVDPEHDAQGGVFAMYNPSIWPIAESPEEIQQLQTVQLDGAVNASIINFDYGSINASVGQPVVFSNSDSVPHTVTAGTASAPTFEFDSGLMGTGDAYELTFDEPGEFALFCALHPGMNATVTVEAP